MWAMIGMYNYLLYSGDEDLVEELWPKHESALEYARSLRTADGIVSVKGDRDWGRITSSKERCSASMLYVALLYHSCVSLLMNIPQTLPLPYYRGEDGLVAPLGRGRHRRSLPR